MLLFLYDEYEPVNPLYPYWKVNSFCLDSGHRRVQSWPQSKSMLVGGFGTNLKQKEILEVIADQCSAFDLFIKTNCGYWL